MQVQLRDKVAECGAVDPGAVKMLFDKARDNGALFHDRIALQGGQIQQIGAIHLWHQYEPRDHRVLVQKHVAEFQPAEQVGVGEQLVMYYKPWQG